uniref:Uncharacterized protein n=1 Tax=Vespula pensylvanica TaxID=30213 RepID=A0A834UAT2_VESPE|nr:hypothetical protein H0235_006900 [Vespula pensylvanica]
MLLGIVILATSKNSYECGFLLRSNVIAKEVGEGLLEVFFVWPSSKSDGNDDDDDDDDDDGYDDGGDDGDGSGCGGSGGSGSSVGLAGHRMMDTTCFSLVSAPARERRGLSPLSYRVSGAFR